MAHTTATPQTWASTSPACPFFSPQAFSSYVSVSIWQRRLTNKLFTQGTNTPTLPVRTPAILTRLNLPLNLGTLAAVTYSTLYLLLSPNLAGVSVTPIVMSFAALSNKLMGKYNRSKVNTIAIAVHIVSWIAQFVGHGKYEGRKPALLDNLVQALFLAPLFVWYEILFKLGLYKKLQKEVEVGVEEQVAKLKIEGKAKE